MDPTVGVIPEEATHFIGATEAAKEAEGKTVFESRKERKSDKRKRNKNDNPSDIEGFLGPWGGYVDEKRVMKPSEVSRLCFEMQGRTQIKTTLIFLNYRFEIM
jgi:pre-mRNA-processing factor 17